MIASSLRRSTVPVAAVLAAAVLALSSLVTAQAQTPVVSTRADTSIDVLTNVATGSGASTALGTLTLTAAGTELTTDGDIRIVAPAGWSFDTAADVTYATTGALQVAGGASGTVNAESAGTLTFDVTTASAAGDTLTLSGIRVTPDSGATMSGNLGLSLDGDADVANGSNDAADISTLTITGGAMAPGFDRAISAVGVTPAVWNGGTVAQLEAAITGAGGVSGTVFAGGQAVVLIPGAPAFVNAGFNAEFSSDVTAGTIVLVTR